MQSRIINHVTVLFGISGCSFDGGEHEDSILCQGKVFDIGMDRIDISYNFYHKIILKY
jgi:hypothetical protein